MKVGSAVSELVTWERDGAGVCRLMVVGSLNWGEELGRDGSFSSSEEFLYLPLLVWEAEGGRFSCELGKELLNCGGCLAGVEDGADCEPLIPNAAISCGSNGRDFLRVFWRRF